MCGRARKKAFQELLEADRRRRRAASDLRLDIRDERKPFPVSDLRSGPREDAETLPAGICTELGLPQGSTYDDAVALLRHSGGSGPRNGANSKAIGPIRDDIEREDFGVIWKTIDAIDDRLDDLDLRLERIEELGESGRFSRDA
jgi:hypothetical protein